MPRHTRMKTSVDCPGCPPCSTPAPAIARFDRHRGGASGRRSRVRSLLVAAEVALSVVLVVVGGQLLASFLRLVTTDPGFRPGHVLASVILPAPERYPTPTRRSPPAAPSAPIRWPRSAGNRHMAVVTASNCGISRCKSGRFPEWYVGGTARKRTGRIRLPS